MKKEFKINGMNCNHCRNSIESALNSLDGINAKVTLEPPIVIIDFIGKEMTVQELQEKLSEVGDYIILE